MIARERQRAPDAVLPMPQDEELGAVLLKAGAASLDSALVGMQAGAQAPEAGRPLRLWFGPELGNGARLVERVEYRVSAGRRAIITRKGEEFIRREVTEPVDDTPVRIRLGGESNLAVGLIQAGLPTAVRQEVTAKADGQRTTAVDLIVAHEQTDSGGSYGAPLYLGLHLEDGSILRWLNVDGALRPLGSVGSATGLLQPVLGRVTSQPGLRLHPILRYLRWHRGTDFAAPAGTPVQAALGGRVIEAGWQGGFGRTVRMVHADGSQTLYAHLSAFEVAEGTEVPQGTIIGRVGASGLATGPHLHFEWRRGGETLRPAFARSHAGLVPYQAARLQALLAAPFRLPPERRS